MDCHGLGAAARLFARPSRERHVAVEGGLRGLASAQAAAGWSDALNEGREAIGVHRRPESRRARGIRGLGPKALVSARNRPEFTDPPAVRM